MSEITNNRIKLEETKPRNEGDNWIGTLKLHSIISGLLAIVTVSLLIYASNPITIVGDYFLISLLSVSFFLFTLSAELYISAISFDMFNLSEDIKKTLKKECEEEKLNWEDYVMKQLAICKNKKKQAKIVRNIAFILLFITFLLIIPYGFNFFLLFAGIGYLIWQLLNRSKFKCQKKTHL
ncbi:MAG: hypothetical protein ACFFHD_16295 [Promethearchaeota archaeon]